MALNPARMRARRRAYSASMTGTVSMGPVSAASAAYCEIEQGLEVAWLCTLSIASITGLGARPYPRRQPVIEKVFESEPTMIRWGFDPLMLATEYGRAAP